METKKVLRDPNFQSLPEVEKIKVLSALDQNFAALSPPEQSRVFKVMGGGAGGRTSPAAEVMPRVPQEIASIPSVADAQQHITRDVQSATGVGTVGENSQQKIRNETLETAAKNLPGSALQVGKDLASAIMSPIQTAKSIFELAKGTVQLAIPGEQGSEDVARQVGQFYADRYGSLEETRQTFMKDPAGFALDVTSVVSLSGAVTRGVGAAAGVEKVRRAGLAMERVGAYVDPVAYGAKGVSLMAKTIPSNLANNLYQRAAKWSTTLSLEDRAKITNTALDNQIMPTVAGLDKLNGMLDTVNGQIVAKIDEAVQTGRTIQVVTLFKDFDKLLKIDGLGAKPLSASRAINSVRSELVKANRSINRVGLTPAEAQKLKQTIYKELDTAYAKQMVTEHSKKAQMAVARAAKEGIEDIVPEIKGLNRLDGDLIELKGSIERAAARISNHDIWSLRNVTTSIAGGAAGASMGGPAGAVGVGTGLAVGVLMGPKVQAKLAIVINKLKKKGIEVSPNGTAARLGIIQVERTQQDQQDEE